MARINVTVPDEQKEWLEDQPHLNASGLLQKAIQEEQEKRPSEIREQYEELRDLRDRLHDLEPDVNPQSKEGHMLTRAFGRLSGLVADIEMSSGYAIGELHDKRWDRIESLQSEVEKLETSAQS